MNLHNTGYGIPTQKSTKSAWYTKKQQLPVELPMDAEDIWHWSNRLPRQDICFRIRKICRYVVVL